MSVADIYRNRGVNPLAVQTPPVRSFANWKLYGDANLVSYWSLNGNSTDVKNAHNGTDAGIVYSSLYGKYAKGAGMFLASSMIYVASTAFRISGASPLTESFWVYATGASIPSSGKECRLCSIAIATGTSQAYDKAIILYPDGYLKFHNWDGAAKDASSLAVFGLNAWHLVTATFDGTNSNLYIDGVLQQATPTSSTYDEGAGAVLIFSNASETATAIPLNGAMCEVAFFSRALTAAEVGAYYAWSIG